MEIYTKDDFFAKFGSKGFIVQVNENDPEIGDYQLYCPEEMDRAKEYQDKGYKIASVFETEDGEDIVKFDNDIGAAFHKIGYIIVDGVSPNE